jgi:hypothetical protein
VATVQWRAGDGKYSIATESRAAIFGKVVENRSEGAIDDFGLAPVSFYEKRLRKDPYTTSFKRAEKTIAFTESDVTYPILGASRIAAAPSGSWPPSRAPRRTSSSRAASGICSWPAAATPSSGASRW